MNKAAIVRVTGGPAINKIDSSAIPPGNIGYQPYGKYATSGDQGQPGQVQVAARQRRRPATG